MLQIPNDQLKSLLVKDGVIKSEDFDSLAKDASRMGQGVSDILIAKNIITATYLLDLAARFYEVDRIDLSNRSLTENIIQLIPEDIARQKRTIVFNKREDGSFDVAMENPIDLEAVEFLSKYLKGRVNSYLVSTGDLNYAFSFYGKRSAESFKKAIEENIQATMRSEARGDTKRAASEIPVIAIVDNMVSYAISSRASDIHIEALEKEILVRYRIDGVLHEIIRVPQQVHPAVIARIKLLSSLKLDEHSRPQDGRFRYKLGQDVMDIRVAIMPTFYGEKIVMRLLSATQKPLSLEELGMFEDHSKLIREAIKKTFGMILITGPTGCGKTTTLYSMLNMLNRPEVNIVTVEDPIEYDMKYVNQTQINPVAGISFAGALREIVRQDPNIIMVGEIRDQETAEIAIQSALTGHLVLSSLHTNDAPTAIPRLLDMKVVPFLAAAVLNLVQAQRLVRRICLGCIYSYIPDKVLMENIKSQLKELGFDSNYKFPNRLYKGAGCSSCGGTGYKGRLGIFEVLDVNEKIRQLIASPDFTLDALKQLAKEEGMITMFEDGLRKVERGMTTIEEVFRVIRE